MKFFLLTFLFCTALFAADNDCVSCGPDIEANSSLEKKISSLMSAVEMNCSDVLKQDVDDEYKTNFSGPKKSSLIKGMKLEGTQDELNFLKKMVGEKPLDQWSKASACTTVLCALSKAYDSETTAKRVLNIAKRNGYIVSMGKDFTNEKGASFGQMFSGKEIEDIDLAYKKLPANFRKLKTLEVLKRMPDGFGKPGSDNTAAYARPGYHSSYISQDGEIVFLDKAFSKDLSWGPMVAVHELSHHLDFSNSDKTQFGISEGAEFKKLSGWQTKKEYKTTTDGKKVLTETWESAPGKKFVRDYAGTEPAEDFAEAIAYYIYHPGKLKAIDPDKYNFVKNKIFAGKEFDKEVDFQKTPEDFMRICMEKTRPINIAGYNFISDFFEDCLDDFAKNFKPTEPSMCLFNKDQIKLKAYMPIEKDLEDMNNTLVACNKNAKELQKQCYADGDVRVGCAVERCQIPPNIASKVKGATANNKDMINAIESKFGKANFYTSMLIGGFASNNKFLSNYPLYMQKAFHDGASKTLAEKLTAQNFKLDAGSQLNDSLYSNYFFDKPKANVMESFQKKVYAKVTSSPEKNMELIKEWASSESLGDTPLYKDLADQLATYSKNVLKK